MYTMGYVFISGNDNLGSLCNFVLLIRTVGSDGGIDIRSHFRYYDNSLTFCLHS